MAMQYTVLVGRSRSKQDEWFARVVGHGEAGYGDSPANALIQLGRNWQEQERQNEANRHIRPIKGARQSE